MSTPLNCNEPAEQLATAAYHEIDQTVFNTYLSNFWGASARSVIPVTKSWTELSSDMTGKDCATQCWKLEFDQNDTVNNDISFGFQTMVNGEPPAYAAGNAYYPIALFKGIKLDIDAASFEFYKAIDRNDLYTVIFKAIAEDQNTKYYDLSNDWPPKGR